MSMTEAARQIRKPVSYTHLRGDVILNNKTDPIDNEEYEDFQKTYKCYVMPEEYQDLEMVARNVYAWLYQTVQYSRLDDSYERNYYLSLIHIFTATTDGENKQVGSVQKCITYMRITLSSITTRSNAGRS